jgi:hypothetical protein
MHPFGLTPSFFGWTREKDFFSLYSWPIANQGDYLGFWFRGDGPYTQPLPSGSFYIYYLHTLVATKCFLYPFIHEFQLEKKWLYALV